MKDKFYRSREKILEENEQLIIEKRNLKKLLKEKSILESEHTTVLAKQNVIQKDWESACFRLIMDTFLTEEQQKLTPSEQTNILTRTFIGITIVNAQGERT